MDITKSENIEKLTKLLRDVLFLNEVGGDAQYVYRFSDADGFRTGRSGWSFGVSQFDIAHNADLAPKCLKAIGFTDQEIDFIKKQIYSTQEMARISVRLKEKSSIVDKYDLLHMGETVSLVANLLKKYNCTDVDVDAFLALCDYHNQFCISPNGKMEQYVKTVIASEGKITFAHVSARKSATKWGKDRPDDVRRRDKNIKAVASKP